MKNITILLFFIIPLNGISQTSDDFNFPDRYTLLDIIPSNITCIDKSAEIEIYCQLETVSKIWGYLKYYDSSVSENELNWDSVLVNCVGNYYNEQDSETFNNKFYNDFLRGNNQILQEKDFPDLKELSWIQNSSNISDKNKTLLKSKLSSDPFPNFFVSLNPKSKNCIFRNEKRYKDITFPNKEYQLLTLFKYWNAIKYYYPYKHLMDNDWDDVLRVYLPLFYNCTDEVEFHKLVFRLTTELRDTHVQTGSDVISNFMGYYFPRFRLTYIDEKFVVSSFISDSISETSPFKIGDILLKKDGIPVDKIYADIKSYYSASNEVTTNKYIADWLLLGISDSAQYVVKRGSDTLSINAIRILRVERQKIESIKRKRNPFKKINDDIGYINIGSLNNNQIDSIFLEANNLKGIIIDMREYPNETYYKLCSKLIDKDSVSFVRINYPDISIPGDFTNEFELKINGSKTDYYRGKVVLLIDENTQSQGEFSTMALECAPNTVKIGSQTAGADGNVSQIYLPFGIATSFSGLRILYPNGKETQRIGIVPDIKVVKTLSDVLKGEDTVLKYAISYLNRE